MITPEGFYPINALQGIPLTQQAKDHGTLNKHILRVEDIEGNILWSRIN
jgi:hypothetical protein